MAEPSLRAVAFPTLDDARMRKLAGCSGAKLERYRAGTPLFVAGERGFEFFLVKSGELPTNRRCVAARWLHHRGYECILNVADACQA